MRVKFTNDNFHITQHCSGRRKKYQGTWCVPLSSFWAIPRGGWGHCAWSKAICPKENLSPDIAGKRSVYFKFQLPRNSIAFLEFNQSCHPVFLEKKESKLVDEKLESSSLIFFNGGNRFFKHWKIFQIIFFFFNTSKSLKKG